MKPDLQVFPKSLSFREVKKELEQNENPGRRGKSKGGPRGQFSSAPGKNKHSNE